MRSGQTKADQEGPQAPAFGTRWLRPSGPGSDRRSCPRSPASRPLPTLGSAHSSAGETAAPGRTRSRESGSNVYPSPALPPFAPGCHLPPGPQTRRPPSRCRGRGRPRPGACEAPSFSSVGPWQVGTAVGPPGASPQPCGPGTGEREGAEPAGRTTAWRGVGAGPGVYPPRAALPPRPQPQRLGAPTGAPLPRERGPSPMLWGTRGVRTWALPPGANGSGRARRTLAGAGDGRAEHTSLGPGCPRESVRAVPGAGTWGDLSGRGSRIPGPG